MSSGPPKRSITPYAPFAEPPPATERAPAPAPTPPPPDFERMIRAELELVEQSITENVKRSLQKLGTLVVAKHDETQRRLDAHARELGTLRDALEHAGTILPPPPEGP